jgi:hypothetical protein
MFKRFLAKRALRQPQRGRDSRGPGGARILRSRCGAKTTFESGDKAVTFVMEELSEVERSHASVLTSSRLISIDDIAQIYAARNA